MKLKTAFALLIVCFISESIAGKSEDENFKPTISPYLKIQFWNVFSDGITVGEEISGNRFASYFRRGRFGVKGKALPELTYDLMLSLDNLGKDSFMSTKGAVNSGNITVWSAYFTYKLSKNSGWLNATGGYFLPHVSRESTTTPWSVSSLDKTENSCYIRQFVTGKTNGISPGINFGGMGNIGKPLLMYNIAIINRQDVPGIMNKSWSPVWLGHVMINFGQPEFKKYKYTFLNNLLKKQTSATLGVGFSDQGETDVFQTSKTFSADATIYFGCLKMDGEFSHLYRKNQFSYHANCAMVRAGYNFFVKKELVLEPMVMFEHFEGDENFNDASFFDGTDQKIDLGLNLISKTKNIKVNLHYVFHKGDGKKNHYINNDKYPGDYIVLGCQFLI